MIDLLQPIILLPLCLFVVMMSALCLAIIFAGSVEAAELGKGHTSAALLVNSCQKLVSCTFKLSNLISADNVYDVPQALCIG